MFERVRLTVLRRALALHRVVMFESGSQGCKIRSQRCHMGRERGGFTANDTIKKSTTYPANRRTSQGVGASPGNTVARCLPAWVRQDTGLIYKTPCKPYGGMVHVKVHRLNVPHSWRIRCTISFSSSSRICIRIRLNRQAHA